MNIPQIPSVLHDVLIGAAFTAMILVPSLVASISAKKEDTAEED
jgi:hypothetical protein